MNLLWLFVNGLMLIFGYAKSECSLPTGNVIDWEKMSGEWYQVLTDNTAFDKMFTCMSGFITPLEKDGMDGYSEEGLAVFRNSTTVQQSVQVLRKGGGYYRIFIQSDKNSEEAMESAAKEKMVTGVSEHRGVIKYKLEESSFFTDNKTYFLQLQCDNSGHKEIWGYSRRKQASVEVLLGLTNLLANIGNGWSEVPLHLLHCE